MTIPPASAPAPAPAPASDAPRRPQTSSPAEGVEPPAPPLPMLLGRILAQRWLAERRGSASGADAAGRPGEAASEGADRAIQAPR